MNCYALVLAGGGGTRFWPISRNNLPKQLINLSGEDILINETLKRLTGLVQPKDTFIVTNQSQAQLLKTVLLTDIEQENILIEPLSKNTAPCILYSALSIYGKLGDGIICIFPSDHHIQSVSAFQQALKRAIDLAEEEHCLVTLGIKPTFPSTGYGYIRYNETTTVQSGYKVEEFIEKPHYDKAVEFIQRGNFLWNSGILVGKLSCLIEDFKRFLPRIHEKLWSVFIENEPEAFNKRLNEQYEQLQNISIDYGILERADHVYVIPGDFGWNDVGSWDALGSIYKPDEEGNVIKADHIGIGTKNSIIYGNEQLIATVGLEDMIVVATEDSILICPRNRAQEVRRIVEKLKENNRVDLL